MTNNATMPVDYGIAPAGYRLPAATRLGLLRLQVSDLERSVQYYEAVLGLRLLHRDGSRALLGNQADDAALLELNEKPGVNQVPRRGRIGLYHFAILLPDRASLGRFVLHLSALGEQAGMSDHLVSEAVYLSDPDGLGIEVYADRPRESWQVAGRELAMTTQPLDVHDLISGLADRRWRGAPAGTRGPAITRSMATRQ